MSFLFELDPKDEASAGFVAEVGRKLQCAVTARGLSQKDIADRIGVDRSRVNKCLSGFNNLTLKSLAELTWALDGKIQFEIELNEGQQEQVADEQATNVVLFVAKQNTQEQSVPTDLAELQLALG